jgi:hypothetical protein
VIGRCGAIEDFGGIPRGHRVTHHYCRHLEQAVRSENPSASVDDMRLRGALDGPHFAEKPVYEERTDDTTLEKDGPGINELRGRRLAAALRTVFG